MIFDIIFYPLSIFVTEQQKCTIDDVVIRNLCFEHHFFVLR